MTKDFAYSGNTSQGRADTMADISVATYSLTEGANGSQVSIVFSDGSAETITDKHANFASIVQALITKPEGYGPVVYDLANIAKTVGRKFKTLSARVTTDGSELYFDGDAIHGTLAQFILKLLREDAEKAAAFFGGSAADDGAKSSQVTWEALVKFLELIYSNPNAQSRDSLYEFIARYGLTIRKDGYFIAYKGVDAEFGSKNQGYGIVDGVEVNGVLYNKPGSVLRYPRKDVDSNTSVGCSQGLHAGTHAYATNWARGGKLVAVAINPMNVVSVPDDCTFQKLRVCEYEVLNEVDPLEEALATGGWDSVSFWDVHDETDNDGDACECDDCQDEDLYEGSYEEDPDNYDDSDCDCGDCTAEEQEEEQNETRSAQSGTDFLNGIRDTLLNGGGVDFADLLKGAQGLIPDDIREKSKKIVDGSGIGDVLGFLDNFVEGFVDGLAEDSTDELSEGDSISFDYTAMSGEKQHVEEALIEEIHPEHIKAFVPAKDGYRTFKFDGIANLVVLNGSSESENSGSVAEQFAALKIGDQVNLELQSDGKKFAVENATVLLANGTSVTVRLAGGGYKAFTADNVVKISLV